MTSIEDDLAADLNALNIYLALGYSDVEFLQCFGTAFLESCREQDLLRNNNRFLQISYKIKKRNNEK